MALKEYDEALETYIPVLMAMAKIYWDVENYPMAEKIFRQIGLCLENGRGLEAGKKGGKRAF